MDRHEIADILLTSDLIKIGTKEGIDKVKKIIKKAEKTHPHCWTDGLNYIKSEIDKLEEELND